MGTRIAPRNPQKGTAGAATATGVRVFSGVRLARLPIDALPISFWISQEIDRRRLFLWLPVAFGLGVVGYFQAEVEPSIWAPVIAFAGCCLAAILLRKKFAGFVCAIGLAFVFAGFTAGITRSRIIAAPVLASPVFVSLDGWIETIDWNVYGGRMIVRLADMSPPVETMPERVRLTFRGKPDIESGKAVRLKARLSPPNRAVVPGGFDFQREAYFQRLGAVGFTTGQIAAAPDLGAAPLRARLASFIDQGRNTLTARIMSVVGGGTGAIAAALITGKRGQIPDQDNDNLRAAGIYHIVSISGLHMVLAAGLFFWLARLLLVAIPGVAARHPIKKWAAAVAMVGATAYDIFSGSEVATERSLIMTLVMFGAILVDRPALAMRNLAISALIILVVEPETLLGPSFQMSFAAVAGLVAYGEIERQRRIAYPAAGDWISSVPDWLWKPIFGILMTTIIATFATAPFQAYHFHRLNPYGALGNALAIPLCSFIVMPAALIGVVLYPFGLDAPVWWIMGLGVGGIQNFAAWVGAIDGSVVTVVRFGAGALMLMTIGILCATLASVAPLRLVGIGIFLSGSLISRMAERPEMILDSSGKAALTRGIDGRMALIAAQRPSFALQQWLPGDLDSRGPKDASLVEGTRCDKLGCTGQLADGRKISVITDPAAFAEDCERAAIIITGLAAPPGCWDKTEVFDRAFFDSYGATYLYKSSTGWRLETARNERKDRPWSPKPPIIQQKPLLDLPENSQFIPSQPWDSQSPDVLNQN